MPPSTHTHTHTHTLTHTPGDETTRPGWEFAVIVGIDDDEDEYSVIWDFNGEQVRRVGGDGGGHVIHTNLHSP